MSRGRGASWGFGSGLYTLSEKSRNVLEGLSQPVDFVIFLAPEDPVYEPVRELLQRYAAASPEVPEGTDLVLVAAGIWVRWRRRR